MAADLGQDLLLVDFQSESDKRKYTYNRDARDLFLAWLKQHPQIRFKEAYPPLDPGIIICPYPGTIAVVACKEKQPDIYSLVVKAWENPDGTPKHPPTVLYIVEKGFRTKR
ncbi:MAG TPA: hypothetical protein VFO10_02760 [Oligoflexus sp.]|uniref:hypothetical protein n=1 Tax=Oligoflexus sp. TaxID=1971216 RepID=UPI002D7FA9A9|nr:hypothetical protein [Oligoflexus sp.]HET9236143.1 hypothetical protein [Oligoflexus sp.]